MPITGSQSDFAASVGSITASPAMLVPATGVQCLSFEITSHTDGTFTGTIPSINGKVLRAYGIADGTNNPSGGFTLTFTESATGTVYVTGGITLTSTTMAAIAVLSSTVSSPFVMLFSSNRRTPGTSPTAITLTASGMGSQKKARIILYVENGAAE